MQITGTKKFFVFLITLLCAIAVGLGITLISANNSAAAKEVEYSSQGEDKLVSPDSSYVEVGEELSDAEDEYDPRFDEFELRTLAEQMELDYELVNFFAHATDTSVAELRAKFEEGCDGNHAEDECCNDLGSLIDEFKEEYVEGNIALAAEAEEEDWYLAPDEVSTYATWTYLGFDTDFRYTITSSTRGALTVDWTYYTPNVFWWGDVYNELVSLSTTPIASKLVEYSTYPSQGGFGRVAQLVLDPGETVTIYVWNAHHHYNGLDWMSTHQYLTATSYYSSTSGYGTENATLVIDGDAPTGSLYAFGSGRTSNSPSSSYRYHVYKANPVGCVNSSSGTAYYNSKVWWNELQIVRNEPDRPYIVDQGDGGAISGNTKTIYYTGEAAQISFYPDWGSGILHWETSSPNLVIYDRAIHGQECKNLVLETQVAGTYFITLSTPTGRWADGSTGSVTFTFILKKNSTAQPQMLREAGVADNLKSKTVNDIGEAQTVTFINCDKNFLSWEANGLYELEWTDDGRLTLYQSYQNIYQIQIFITNPDGCTWTNGTTSSLNFTFTIKEMLIDTPVQVGASGMTKTVDYDGETKTMTLAPATLGQLSILAPGLPYTFMDDGTVVFSTVNAASYDIKVSPAQGYVWQDQTTTTLHFTFTINTIKLTAPRLEEPTAVNGRKTVVYNPSGEANTMTISNIREGEITYSTAMGRLSWDYETATLVLGATEAYTYYISFEVANSNYEWAKGTTVSTYVLVIERYTLEAPYIIESEAEIAAGQIEGNTKTVAYEAPASDKYIKLFTGGILGQLTVEVERGISENGVLVQDWDVDNTILTLKGADTQTGADANNYLIKITPTSNYQWDDGTFELKDFKLVISPILRNPIPMYIQNSGNGSTSWDTASGGKGSLQYDGTAKKFRIGNAENSNEYYDTSAMYYDFVDAGGNVISQSEAGLTIVYEGNYVEFSAVNAGEYWIRLNLWSTNYAWRDGSGISFYFVFTITAMPIDIPYIVKDECGGYEVGNKIYSTYMYGIYDGNDFTMTISVKAAKYVTATFYDGEYNLDTEMRAVDWSAGEDIDRLVVTAHSVGSHIVRLEINDTNFRWADPNVPFYEFEIRIDYAQITGVTFTFNGDSGTHGVGFSSEYKTGEEPNQLITVTRTVATEFVDTPFKSQFDYTVELLNEGTLENVDINLEELSCFEFNFLDAGIYVISIYPNENYCWTDGTRLAHICMFNIAKKMVALPEIRDLDDGGTILVEEQTKKITYNKENLYIVLDLGEDYPAYAVATDYTSSGLTRDNVKYGAQDEIGYFAVNVNDYELGIRLKSSINYEWQYEDVFVYRFAIERLAIGGPEAYVIGDKIDNEHIGEIAGMEGRVQMSHGDEQTTIETYKGEDYYVYLIGESILNFTSGGATYSADVTVTISLEKSKNDYADAANGSKVNTDGAFVLNNGLTAGYEYAASQVNVYTITVSIVTLNCYWKGDNAEEDVSDMVFTLQIEKRELDMPQIVGYEDAELIDDCFHVSFVYNGGHRTINIKNFLYGGQSVTYMKAVPSLLCDMPTDAFVGSGLITIQLTTDLGSTGPKAANVDGEYYLTITLDSDNERWKIEGEDDNITPKYYYIDIEKLPVAAPTVNTGLDSDLVADMDDTSVSVIYNGEKWADAMTITGLNSNFMSYKVVSPSTTDGILSADGSSITVSTITANAGYYTVTVSLADPGNLKWIETDDSSDLDLSFIIKPQPVAKPVVYDPDGGLNDSAEFTDTSLTVTYNYDVQYIFIANYLNNSELNLMSSEVISSYQFISGQFDETTGYLIYSAKNAGQYVLRISISANAEWDDGSGNAPVDILFDVQKLQFATPFVVPEDDDDLSVSASGLTKTVMYALDENGNAVEYFVKIAEYNDQIMSLYNLTSSRGTDYPFMDGNIDENGNRVFSAKYAGTYTVTFRMNDFENMRWEYADNETVTLTLVINKLVLENPYINQDYLVTGETVAGNITLNSVYDGKAHSAIVENVLNTYYITFDDATDYAAMNSTNYLTYDRVSRADNDLYPTVGEIYTPSHSNAYVHPNDNDATPITLKDFITLSAGEPGTYRLKFVIADREDAGSENMVWADGTSTEKYITIVISKMTLSSPVIKAGTSATQQYNGREVYFYIDNVDNGCADITDWNNGHISTYEYVTPTLGQAVTSTQEPLWAIESCYGGTLILKATEIGTYYVTISIANTDTTVWTDFSQTKKTFTLVVEKRTVSASFEFNSDDAVTQTNLQNAAQANTTPEWSVSTPVNVTVTISGLCMRYTGMDKDVAAEIYYTTLGGNTATFKKIVTSGSWSDPVLEANGTTYSVSYTYALPYGEQNIAKGNYTLHVVQNGSTGNYSLTSAQQNFKIAADPAPFETDWLVWRYKVDDGEYVTVDPENDLDEDGVLHLDFLPEGGTYYFSAFMTDEGMNGRETLEAALLDWEVRLSNYSGTQNAMYSGSYTVIAKIVAKDSDLYFFADYNYTLKYSIDSVKYDLSGLEWDYSGTPFIFDGEAKTVRITGELPSGLTVYMYIEDDDFDLNSQIYAGEYTSKVKFTSSNANYIVPDFDDPDSYTGSFDWTCDWEIAPCEIDVSWRNTQSSAGSSVSYVPVLNEHGEKVDYIYYIHNGNEFVETTEFLPNRNYQVEAVLKSNPDDPATDYARNYVLKFTAPDVNPSQFYLGPNTGISSTVTVQNTPLSPTADNIFYYNGEEFAAEISIVDPLGNLTDDNVIATYYSSVNYNKPLAGAPTDPGTYRVKLSFVDLPDDGISYALDIEYYDFVVKKGEFNLDDLYLRYTHTTSNDETIVAVFDEYQNKWVREDNGQEVEEFTYDGSVHTVELVSDDENLVIILKNQSYIDAGSYTTKLSFIYDGNKWEAPNVASEINWTIEKAVLDLSLIEWNYTDDFVYSLSGGEAKKYSVQLENIPEFLLDYITYTTSSNGSPTDNSQSAAGSYITTCTIADLPENSNYVVGEWPDSIGRALDWEISTKKLAVPAANGNWVAFDGSLHNILSAISLDVDWETYFDITVEYAGNAYDGTNEYGYEYFAFHAGSYALTFTLKSSVNKDNTNVEWITYVGGVENYTVAPQSATLTVASADMEVYDWDQNDESSTVYLRGAYYSDKFIGYKFYAGSTGSGTEVNLNDVLNSSSETFSIVPYVLAAYDNDISLSFAAGVAHFITFTTYDYDSVPEDDWRIIAKTPYITGYTIDGVYHEITREEWIEILGIDETLSEEDIDAALTSEAKNGAVISIIYSGKPVTFEIFNWNSYYVNHLDVWNGSVDDLTQNEAGTYTVTFILKKDTVNPRSWGQNDDGTFDRSSVTVTFRIKYLMLTVPELPELTYDGTEQDILEAALGSDGYAALLEEYGDYVEISGFAATEAGKYTLYLTIKDEFVNTVRWDNGTELGLPGTLSIDWEILPIYLVKPNVDLTLTATYDGYAHSVFEVLEGYLDGDLSEELQLLRQYARLSVSGGTGVNAGTYTAVFSLPNSNFAWVDSFGNVDASSDSITLLWTISRYYLDLSNIGWSYDEDNPFVYTRDNEEDHVFTLELTGIPEELKDYITYLTDDVLGNTKSEIGTYKTIVYFFDSNVDANNYELGAMPSTFYQKYQATERGYLEITWSIEQRKYDLPEDTFGTGGILNSEGEWEYDGTVHELMELFGYEDGWENYFEVTVEYDGGEGFHDYEGYDYSIYKAYYLGSYRLTIKIKEGINSEEEIKVAFGDNGSTEQVVTVTYKQLTVKVEGWTENDQYSTIISDKYDGLSDAAKELFEYVIYDADVYDSRNVYEYYTAEELAANSSSGGRYYIEFRLKLGSEYDATGIDLSGVTRYEFGSYNFDNQPVINWVPLPTLDRISADFTGENISFQIQGWENYVLTQDFIDNWAYGDEYPIPQGANSFIYSLDGSLNTKTGVVTAKKAGEYKLVLRFTSNINLSWYNPAEYSVVDGELVDINGDPVTDVEDLVNRYAQTLTYTVNVAKLQQIDVSKLEELLIEVEYTGTPHNVFDYSSFLAELKAKYGSLIEFENDVMTDAGEYQLIIKLADPESSYWDLGSSETVTVNAEGYALKYVLVGSSYKVLYVAVNADGSVKLDENGNYTEYNGGNYKQNVNYVYSYQVTYVEIGEGDDCLLDENGNPKSIYVGDDEDGNPIYTTIEYVTGEDGKVKRYSLVNGSYVETQNGTHLAKYVLDSNGDKVLNFLPDRDEDGHYVIDAANSTVTIEVRKTSTDPYTADWKITQVGYDSPYINHELDIVYNGKYVFLVSARYGDSNVVVSEGYDADALENTSVLIGYVSSIMSVNEDGAGGIDAGEYTIEITLTDGNHFWSETGTETITLTWYINKAKVDLSEVVWNYTEDTVYTYTRNADETSKIYYVELLNLPEALQNSVVYTTNGKVGAFAGREAGKYITSFTFDIDENNFYPITIPETLPTSITWNIERRRLEVPANNQTWVVFDDSTHNLLELLDLPEDWSLYYSITVYYASDFILYQKYEGYEGNAYLAHGAGGYRFLISILDGINGDATNPNVVWNLSKDNADDDDDELVSPEPVSYSLIVLRSFAYCEEETEEELYEDEEDKLLAPDGELFAAVPYAEDDEENGAEDQPADGADEGDVEDGEDDKKFDEGDIADPLPGDPDDFDWTILDQYITVGVDKIVFLVTGWEGASIGARIKYIPYGNYDQSIIDKIMALDFLVYEIYDVNGNLLPADTAAATITARGYGHTYFIKVSVKGESANYIELKFDKPEYEMFDFSSGFPTNTTVTEIDPPTERYFSAVYTGEDITFEIPYLAQHSGYLRIFEGEQGLIHKNVGVYYVHLCFADSVNGSLLYGWKSTSGDINRSAILITLEIEAVSVTVDKELTCEGYTGYEIDFAELLKEIYGDQIIPAYGQVTKKTEHGTYEIKVVINTAVYGDNLVFKDSDVNADGTVTITWIIPPAVIYGEWNDIGMIDFSKDTSYLAGYEGVVSYIYEDTQTHEVFTSVIQLTKGREYKVTAVIAEEYRENIVWKEGFDTEHIFTLNVDVVQMPKPEFEVAVKVYNGSEQTFVIKNWSEYYEGNVEIVEGSLTATESGTYQVKLVITNPYALWVTDGVASNDELTLEFTISKVSINGTWDTNLGVFNVTGNYGDYIVYKYVDVTTGEELKYSQLETGKTYQVTISIIESAELNYAFAESVETTITFTLETNVREIAIPVIKNPTRGYTGSAIDFTIDDWAELSKYIELIDGNFTHTNAGHYQVILGIKSNSGAKWADGVTGTITLEFDIEKVALDGTWNNTGVVTFKENTYKGSSYNSIVEYVYVNKATQQITQFTDLREGETYIATIRLKDSTNFKFADGFQETYEFTYKKASSNWWIWLLLALAIILFIVIIIIIIIVIKRRAQTKYEYEDIYEDGYYDDENGDYDEDSGDDYSVSGDGVESSESYDSGDYTDSGDFSEGGYSDSGYSDGGDFSEGSDFSSADDSSSDSGNDFTSSDSDGFDF